MRTWLALLIYGSVNSIEGFARRVPRDRPYVRRVLRLAILSPSIALVMLDGKQSGQVSATELLEPDLPHCWRQQAELLTS